VLDRLPTSIAAVLRALFPIETERLRLRPFEHGDIDAFVAIHTHPDVPRYLYWGVRTRAELESVLAGKIERAALARPGDAVDVAVIVRDTGALAASVSLTWHDDEHRQGEIGFIFNPLHQGNGYATEGARALLRVGFEELGLHRIAGRLDARNAASARVLVRLGMRREAHLVENELVKGEWTDEVVYAMLRREWLRTRTEAPR
jgi:RimJ/RimL family protein N-acetyltransferase